MSPDEYRAALPRLGLSSINEAGRWLGVDERMARRWAQDGPPDSIAKLILLMLAEDMTASDVDRSIRAWGARERG